MKIQMPEQFNFLFQPRRNKIMFGGRASAKSYSVGLALMSKAATSTLRILCTREFQNSISDSVHRLLSDINDKYELGYEVTNNSIKHPVTGSEFMFYGLKTNITKIKSLEGVDICYIEEAESISERSLEVLTPTIRKDGSEIWVVFNPYDENDAVYKTFVTPYIEEITDNGYYADSEIHVVKTNYDQNPFLPETIAKEIKKLKEREYKQYQHIYEGLPIGNDENCIIPGEWFDAAIDSHRTINFKPKGIKAVGHDVADTGKDSKAMIHRHGSVVEAIMEWAEGDLEESVEKVYNYAVDNSIQEIVYDSIGVGAGAKIKFKQLDPVETIKVSGFIGSAKPDHELDQYNDSDVSNRDMFKNKRAQGYWQIRDRFYNTYRAVHYNEYIDPDDMISISSHCDYIDQLKSELTKIQRKRTSNSQIQIESKDDMRKRGMKSPNVADALVYAFATSDFEDNIVSLNFASEW